VQETLDIVVKAGGVVEAVALLVDRSGGKASLPCPMVSLLEMEPVTYEPAKCPLCRKGLPLVHPGS
jgi:orotate phosphoribosyltransferase